MLIYKYFLLNCLEKEFLTLIKCIICMTMTLEKPVFSERRQSPRYEIDLSADVVLDDGVVLPVTALNISSTGLKVVCDSWVTDQIEPRGIQVHAVSHIHFKTIIELPITGGGEKIYVNCRILSLQRLSQNRFMLNLVFTGFEGSSESVLGRFLEEVLEKKTVIKAFA